MVTDPSEFQNWKDTSEEEQLLTYTPPSAYDPVELSIVLDRPVDQLATELSAQNPLTTFEIHSAITVAPFTPELFMTDAPTLQAAFKDHVDKTKVLTSDDKFTYDDYIQALDIAVSAREVALRKRIQYFEDQLLQKSAEINGSTVNDVLKFTDRYVLRAGIFGFIESFSNRSRREGEDVLAALFDPTDDATFKTFVEQTIQDRVKEGLFVDNNIFSIDEELKALQTLGAGRNDQEFERLLGVLDAPLFAASAVTKRLLSSTTLASRIGTTAGPSRASHFLDLVFGKTGLKNDDGTILSAFSQKVFNLDSLSPMSYVTNGWLEKRLAENKLLNTLADANERGVFGRRVNRELLEGIAKQQVDDHFRKFERTVQDIDLRPVDKFDNYVWTAILGRKDGSPYASKASAEAAAAAYGGTVYPVRFAAQITQEGGKIVDPALEGWMVKVERNLNLSGYSDAYDVNLINSNMFRGLFSAGPQNEVSRTAALADMVVGGQSTIQTIVKEHIKHGKVAKEDLHFIDDFFEMYRDGVYSFERLPPTIVDFETEYAARFNRMPTKNVVDIYHVYTDVNDTAWKIAADRRLKNALNAGYEVKATVDTTDVMLRRVQTDSLEVNDRVLHGRTGISLQPDQVKAGEQVYQMSEPAKGHIYIIKPKVERPIVHADVLGYNFGGPRTNPFHKYYLLHENTARLAGGKPLILRPTAILGARTEREIETALQSITELRQILDDINTGVLTRADADALVPLLNAFEPSLQNLDDVVKWFNDVGITDGKLAVKRRDLTPDHGDFGFNTGLGSVTDGETSFSFSTYRRDTPVPTYGGEPTLNPDPIAAISQQFTHEAFYLANRNYVHSAMEAWVNAAEKSASVKFSPSSGSRDYVHKFLNAQVVSDAFAGRRLKEERARILRRINVPTSASVTWDRIVNSIGEGLKDLGPPFDRLSRFTDQTLKGDPTTALMGFGFYSKFGFGNWHQLALQSAHIGVISAISPRWGVMAASLTPFVRIAKMGKGQPLFAELSKRLGVQFGLDRKELENILKYLDDSGRLVVSSEQIELGGNQQVSLARSMLAGALDKSTVFFKEGERNSRITSAITAYLEYRHLFPKAEVFSDHFYAWTARRDNELSFNMTATGKTFLQSNSWTRVATQWTSYTLRAMEGIFLGRNLTRGERIRLFSYIAPFFGLTGFGLSTVAPDLADLFGIDVSTERGYNEFVFLKYGVMDGLLNWAEISDDTAIAVRFSPAGGLNQLVYDWTTQPALEILGGPAGKIIYGTGVPFLRMVGDMLHGRISHAGLDLAKVARNISTVDNLTQAVYLYRGMQLSTRNGKSLPALLGNEDIIPHILLGIPLRSVQEYYAAKSASYWSAQAVQDIGARVQEYYTLALEAQANGDVDTAVGILRDTAELMSLLEPWERERVIKTYLEIKDPDLFRVITQLLQTGQEAQAQALYHSLDQFIEKKING